MAGFAAHGSGIIIRTACGSVRPAITSSSSTLSKVAVSLPPGRITGRIFARSSPRTFDCSRPSRARIQLALPRSVLISPLCATNRYGMGERPRRERVRREPLVHESQGRLEGLVQQIGKHAAELRRREHALVDERLRREADDVERPAVRVGQVSWSTACSMRLRITNSRRSKRLAASATSRGRAAARRTAARTPARPRRRSGRSPTGWSSPGASRARLALFRDDALDQRAESGAHDSSVGRNTSPAP